MEKRSYKTYYSVVFRNWGADYPGKAWFDNKAEAEDFASHDYTDSVVRHRVCNPDAIAKYEVLVKRSRLNNE
jgi:hypothetical protein